MHETLQAGVFRATLNMSSSDRRCRRSVTRQPGQAAMCKVLLDSVSVALARTNRNWMKPARTASLSSFLTARLTHSLLTRRTQVCLPFAFRLPSNTVSTPPSTQS